MRRGMMRVLRKSLQAIRWCVWYHFGLVPDYEPMYDWRAEE